MRKAQLNQLPQDLRDHWDGRISQVTVLSREYEFLVISHLLHPAPKFFASCRTDRATPPFISDDVLPEYRSYVMAHEIYEGYIITGQPHRCLRALEYELGCVPAKPLAPYLRFRLQTFDALLEFLRDPVHGTGYSPDMVPLVTEARTHLNRLLR